VRWQKTALLVFSALAHVSAKTKCAVCAVGISECGVTVKYKRSAGFQGTSLSVYRYVC